MISHKSINTSLLHQNSLIGEDVVSGYLYYCCSIRVCMESPCLSPPHSLFLSVQLSLPPASFTESTRSVYGLSYHVDKVLLRLSSRSPSKYWALRYLLSNPLLQTDFRDAISK